MFWGLCMGLVFLISYKYVQRQDAEMICQLTDYKIYWQQLWCSSNCSSSVLYQEKMPNICWFQPLKHEDLLLFSLLYNRKMNIFRFWTVMLTKITINRPLSQVYIHLCVEMWPCMWKLTCPGSSLYWSFCFPSSPRSHWWSAPSWAAAAGSSAWWPPEKTDEEFVAQSKSKPAGSARKKEQIYSMWMLYHLHQNLTYLLASCYVDGSVHSAGRSGETQDQNHINDTQFKC